MPPTSTNGEFVIGQLLRPESFPHEVIELELLETHISWIVLTGHFAYKIKKPVVFDFVDYSTRQARKTFCELELQLNRRFAAEIYLEVVPIHLVAGRYVVGNDAASQNAGISEPVEHAVKMRQFPQAAIVAARLQNPTLSPQAVEDFGVYIASLHRSFTIADSSAGIVQVDRIEKDALDNFQTLRDAFPNDARSRMLAQLEAWTADQFSVFRSRFQQRLDDGMVRQCHGDLHLKNIVQLKERLIAFDGIEFNEEFQWIDVLNELAFPVMDFVARGRADLGWRLLNSYLEISGAYEALDVFRFYLVYRAMVRAKVGWLNPKNRVESATQLETDGLTCADPFAGPWDKYLAAASYFAFELKPSLAITHGFSGSGKSTNAMHIIESDGGVRIRSDVERHRLADELHDPGKYSFEMSRETYSCVLELARAVIKAGFPVIVDATFLKRANRKPFESLSKELEVRFQIIECVASYEELCRRICERKGDASEATIDVLKMQMKSQEPLSAEELQMVRRNHNPTE